MNDLLDALETVATMNVRDQYFYFGLRDDMCRNCYEGLYAVITTHSAEQIFETVARYSDDKHQEKMQGQREKVKKLAEEIGIHNLYAFVKEIRGE